MKREILIYAIFIVCFAGCRFEPSVESQQTKADNPKPTATPELPPESPELPSDLPRLLGVSGHDAPNTELYSWLRFNNDVEEFVAIDEVGLSEIQDQQVVDCRGFLLDDALRNAISNAPKLVWLRLGANTRPADLRWIANLEQLKGLSLSRANLIEADLSLLGKLENLKWLDLRSAKLPTPLPEKLSPFPNLEVLFVDSAQIGDKFVDSLPSMPQMRVISISYSNVTRKGLNQLSQKCPNISVMFLTGAKKVTPDSIGVLKKFERLEYLQIGGTPLQRSWDATTSAVAELKKQLPKCYIDSGQ